MPNDNVQTLTGHAVLDAPIRNAQAQQAETTNVCMQEAQSTWGPRQQNGDNVTTQMTQGAGAKCGGYVPPGWDHSQGIPKCNGLPSLEIDGLDSNMGPFDPNRRNYESNTPWTNQYKPHDSRNGFRSDFEYDFKNGGKQLEKGGCPQFEPHGNSFYPDGKPRHGGPDVRNNPHQGGPSDLHAIPGYGDNPNFNKPHFGKDDQFKNQFGKHGKDDVQMQKMKEKFDGSKCGGSDMTHPETNTTQRRMTESERIIEQKIIDQKIREMKLRERYRL